MKIKGIIIAVLCVAMWSCGARMHEKDDKLVGELNDYMVKVDENHTLEQTVVEGALADTSGQEDIGTFKYVVNFDKESKQLCHIKNIEDTGNTREEDYYFKHNKLVSILVKSSVASDKKIYINNGRIISSLNIDTKEQDLLLTKAKRFQNEYQNK
ncbi:hypothetical protein [Formosa haliotis]|uniref:hypothetical protein n=1 Tax=Formosa haliotis TaxID=1555194 RepID=UPI0008259478|nr:hypothetical protein [Formosa haliotis]